MRQGIEKSSKSMIPMMKMMTANEMVATTTIFVFYNFLTKKTPTMPAAS